MKKVIFIIGLLVLNNMPVEAKWSPIWVTFWPTKAPIDEYKDEELLSTNISLGLLLACQYSVYGIQAGFGSVTRYDMVGLQLGMINKSRNVYGIQFITWPTWPELINPAILNYVENNCMGMQFGIVNYVGNNFIGLQIGAYNDIRNECIGVQLGIINLPKHFKGIQFGFLVNGHTKWEIKTESLKGIQIGLIGNAVSDFQGLQIGLINFCENLKGVQMGILNIAWHSKIPVMVGLNVGW